MQYLSQETILWLFILEGSNSSGILLSLAEEKRIRFIAGLLVEDILSAREQNSESYLVEEYFEEFWTDFGPSDSGEKRISSNSP